MTKDATSPLVGRVLAETYRVERLLGEGGMGAVYLAGHTRLNKRFAIKTLHKEIVTHEEAYRRFRREAEIASELGHPNIIEVIDFDHTHDGIPYMVMEFLDGEDLYERLKRQGSMPPDQLVPLFSEICSALAAAHDKGVVHRDLKPQNIVLTRFGEREDFPKVLDFGISKIKGSGSVLTHGESFMGTPQYMAPEQARGRAAEADARTDIFCLGAIAYRALSGKDAFIGDSIPQVLYLVVHEEPTPLGQVAPQLPPAICAAVHKALQKEPSARFESAKAFGAALSEALESRKAPLAATSQVSEAVVGTADTVLPGLTGPPSPNPPSAATAPAQVATSPQAGVAKERKGAAEAAATVPPARALTAAVETAPILLQQPAVTAQVERQRRRPKYGRVALALTLVVLTGGAGLAYVLTRDTKPETATPELPASPRPPTKSAIVTTADASVPAIDAARPAKLAKQEKPAKRRKKRNRDRQPRAVNWPKVAKPSKPSKPKKPARPTRPTKPSQPDVAAKPKPTTPAKTTEGKKPKPGYTGEGTMGFDG